MTTRPATIIAAVLVVVSGILGFADKIDALALVNPKVAMWWPFVFMAATIIKQLAILFLPAPPPVVKKAKAPKNP